MSTAAVLARTSRAEWSRIWSVRSSSILVAVTAVAVIGIGSLIGHDAARDPSGVPADASGWDGGQQTAMFALFGILALAAVTSTADHATGGIVPTLQWTPRRGVLLVARILVSVATATLLGLLLVTAASVMVRTFLPRVGLPLGDGVQVLGGLAFVFAAGALLAAGLGFALRSTAGALVTVIALVLVLPFFLAQLPYDWSLDLATIMPGSGALFLIFGEGPSDDMTTASARLTLAAWAAGALLLGGWRLIRSDANR